MSGGISPFVVGCERSGTTLLRTMLDAHPSLAIPPESYVTVPLLRHRAGLEHHGGIAVDAVVDHLASTPSFAEWGLDLDALRAEWREEAPASIPDALRDVYGRWAAERGKARVGDKTPFHVRTIDLLAAALPEAAFVHLVRDGRDVASSLVAAPFGPTRFSDAVEHWRRSVTMGRRQGAALGPARYLEVRYEALVEDPERALGAVCALIDLELDEAMLRPHERAAELLAPMAQPEHRRGIEQPVGSAGRDWRTHLPARQVAYFEAATRPLTAELGYELTAPRDGLRARAAVRAQRLRLRLTAAAVRRRKALGRRVGWRPIQRLAADGS